MAEDVGAVELLVVRVDRHQDRADLRQRQPEQRELGLVAQHHRDPVAGADPASGQRRGEPVAEAVDVGEGEAAAGFVEDPGGAQRPQLGGARDELGERANFGERRHVRLRKASVDAATAAEVSVMRAWLTSSSSAGSMSVLASRTRFAIAAAAGGCSAIRFAQLSASAWSCSAGTAALTMPSSAAFRPSKRSPSSRSSFALSGPTSSGSSRDAAPVTLRPSETSGKAKIASSAAITRSQPSANSAPAPIA